MRHHLLLKELPAKDRKKIKDHYIRMLLQRFQACDDRIKSYLSSEDYYYSGSVTKLLTNIDETVEFLMEARRELIKLHKLVGYTEFRPLNRISDTPS